MPSIPAGTKFHGVAPDVETENRGSALANAQRDVYTIEEINAGGGGGVTSIIAGDGISVDQPTGDVTVTATGGGGTGMEGVVIGYKVRTEPFTPALGEFEGKYIKTAEDTTLLAGWVYGWNQAYGGGWELCNSDMTTGSGGTGSQNYGLLGLALGTSSLNDGLLLSGVGVCVETNASTNVLYISNQNFTNISDSPPSSQGDILRILGHPINAAGFPALIEFNPSNDWLILQ